MPQMAVDGGRGEVDVGGKVRVGSTAQLKHALCASQLVKLASQPVVAHRGVEQMPEGVADAGAGRLEDVAAPFVGQIEAFGRWLTGAQQWGQKAYHVRVQGVAQ